MRATDPIGDDPVMNQVVLAYATDMSFMSTGMRPHGMNWRTPGLQTASLDHAIWFHRPSSFNDWHLFAQTSPSASGARGFNLGEIFDIDGRLVASIAQEGLMRYRPLKRRNGRKRAVLGLSGRACLAQFARRRPLVVTGSPSEDGKSLGGMIGDMSLADFRSREEADTCARLMQLQHSGIRFDAVPIRA